MMKLTEKTKRKLRNVLASLLVVCIGPLCERVRNVSGASNPDAFAGKDIVCAIDLDNVVSGAETGFNYEILESFAKDNRCEVRIITSKKGENYLDSLREGKIDIVVKSIKDSIAENGEIMVSRELGGRSVWAMSGNNTKGLRQVNSWICHYSESEEYNRMYRKFFRTYNPYKLSEAGIKSGTLSPYDNLIRQYASSLGWDWKMLAAVVYQESKFNMSVRSPRGATGLMQVMPGTGRHYGVEDLTDPEQNLKAGTAHLKRLQEIFKKEGIEGQELINFTLAAYNAGEGRIFDCRNFAESKNIDNMNWDKVVQIIPLMREDSILEEKSVRLGKFQGYETIAYVDSVMSIYDAFCKIYPAS